MKLTYKLAKVDMSGKHNDRNFDYYNDPHIDNERVKDDIFKNYIGRDGENFADSEMRFYEERFGKLLEERNERRKKEGHGKRAKSIKQFMNSKFNRVEDGWFQIGDKNEHVDGETLWKIFSEWKQKQDELYGSRCIFLNASLHMDEATPHVQFRRVWITKNRRGEPVISKSACLKELGIDVPEEYRDASSFGRKQEGAARNRIFTNSERMLLRTITKEHGIELEPMENSRYWTPMPEYKEQKAEEHLKKLERDIEEKERTFEEASQRVRQAEERVSRAEERESKAEEKLDTYSNAFSEIEQVMLENEQFARDRNLTEKKLKEMSLEERIKLSAEYLRIAADSVKYNVPMADVEALPFRDEYYEAQDYIESRGLTEDFENYKNERLVEENMEDREVPEEEKGNPDELPEWAKE